MVRQVFDPWKISGKVDYGKLVKDFGLVSLKKLPKVFEENVLFRRKIVFVHRDFQRILEAIKNKKPFVMMTGLMPTGKFHIGHMILAQQFVFYQKLGARIYIAVADLEAFHFRGQSLKESRRIALEEYIPGYIALGLKPKNCEIYFQSERSKDAKKANAYYRLQNLLAKHISFNEFKAVYGNVSPGKILASLLQASDMLHAQLPEFEGKMPVLVPVGIDQDPHLRLARDMAKRFKNYDFEQLSSTYHLFVPGLNGGKMSASESSSYIAPTDSPKDVERKIKKYAFSGGQKTIKEHREKGGNPDVDVAFQYLKFLFEPNDVKLQRIYKDYKSGKLLTSELKEIAIKKINAFLKSYQAKRVKAKKKIGKFIYK
jgi:tryptophanyl-tRNA synthetase